jgi:hypothetical protein
MRAISNWTIGLFAYTVIEVPLKQYPVRTDWPGWNHVGSHELLGELFWNMFYYRADPGNKLSFSDMPDFHGEFAPDESGHIARFYGDIGQISASTFLVDVVRQIRAHDLWISVHGDDRQVILEAQRNIGELMGKRIEEAYGMDADGETNKISPFPNSLNRGSKNNPSTNASLVQLKWLME